MEQCQDGTHNKVVFDQFAHDFKGRRLMPGDCFCLDCKQPIPAMWNNGNPAPIIEQSE
jgi:hypothetical protein